MLFFLLLKKRAVRADVYRMLVVVGIILLIHFQPFRIGLDSNVFCVFGRADDNLKKFVFWGRVSSFSIWFVTMVRSVRVGCFSRGRRSR